MEICILPIYLYSLISSILTSSISYFAITFGLIIGSFLNVCIFRIPRNIFWDSHRSFCFYCKEKIPFWLNIPVLSFLLLRGKARCCGSKIGLRYPLVEVLTGLLILLIYWCFPFVVSHDGDYLLHMNELIRFSHAAIFACVMLVCSFIDLEFMIIPDVISLPMIALAPVVFYFHPELTLKSSLFGILLGAACIYAIAWVYYLFRRQEGIGMGDAKLLAVVGGWLGYEAVFPTLLYSSVLGTVIGVLVLLLSKKFSLKAEIPFGPFIAIAALFHQLSPFSFYELWLK